MPFESIRSHIKGRPGPCHFVMMKKSGDVQPNPDPHGAVVFRVYGQVHGVGFRAFVHAAARELDLCGWVRNSTDGTVEALVVGDPSAIEQLAARLNAGPPAARVTRVSRLAVQLTRAERRQCIGFHIATSEE